MRGLHALSLFRQKVSSWVQAEVADGTADTEVGEVCGLQPSNVIASMAMLLSDSSLIFLTRYVLHFCSISAVALEHLCSVRLSLLFASGPTSQDLL